MINIIISYLFVIITWENERSYQRVGNSLLQLFVNVGIPHKI